jgi:putative ABC transport system substrate-binding protein
MVARAQQPGRMRHIGVLMYGVATESRTQSGLAAFMRELRRLGWSEGQNLHSDVRWTSQDAMLSRIYAAELIGLMPDVIVAHTTINLKLLQEATSTVPIVFLGVSDPVAQGLIPTLRQPGGNITGFSNLEFSVGGNWLQLLKEAAPRVARVAVLFNPETAPQSKFYMPAIEAAGSSQGVQVIAIPVRVTADIEPALASFARQPDGGLILTAAPASNRPIVALIAELALRYRLPSISPQDVFARNGGLIGYGPLADQWREAAGYVDRILKDEKPGDLPVQGPVRFRFIINLKTAKALGLTIPETLLATADEVIQ